MVASPVVKYLEGAFREELRDYSRDKLHKWQFGFVKGIGID